jgi:hypothetical protein
MHRRVFSISIRGPTACGSDRSPSYERIHLIAIVSAARIPMQTEFLAGTGEQDLIRVRRWPGERPDLRKGLGSSYGLSPRQAVLNFHALCRKPKNSAQVGAFSSTCGHRRSLDSAVDSRFMLDSLCRESSRCPLATIVCQKRPFARTSRFSLNQLARAFMAMPVTAQP